MAKKKQKRRPASKSSNEGRILRVEPNPLVLQVVYNALDSVRGLRSLHNQPVRDAQPGPTVVQPVVERERLQEPSHRAWIADEGTRHRGYVQEGRFLGSVSIDSGDIISMEV